MYRLHHEVDYKKQNDMLQQRYQYIPMLQTRTVGLKPTGIIGKKVILGEKNTLKFIPTGKVHRALICIGKIKILRLIQRPYWIFKLLRKGYEVSTYY